MALVLEFIVSASRICKGPVRASFTANEAGPDARVVMVIVVFLFF